jgi:predicted dehydrogenase
MKQVLQSLRNGQIELADVPCPSLGRGSVLIRTSHSLISAGTERMLIDFGKANLVDKARQQPDKVRQTLDKARTDGLASAFEAVRSRLDEPLPLGYCNVGRVLEVGSAITDLKPGDRVASNGKHAEVVDVPRNLCAKVPDGVDDEQAVFTVIGSIALQSLRLVQPTLGELVAVSGLGLVGLMAVQLLRLNGCRVLGLDLNPERLALAKEFGADMVDLSNKEDPVAAAQILSNGHGVDAVIVAAATKSSEPIRHAAHMCRKRGRIVLVGATGLELSRDDFYEKELTFQVSCSYGPGRYDSSYEQAGLDYPIGFVRWTEQRNFEAILHLMAEGRLNVAPLISHRLAIDDVRKAYDLVSGSEPSLGILLEYKTTEEIPDSALLRTSIELPEASIRANPNPTISFIGAGNHARRVLMPALKDAGAHLKHVASSGGVSGLLAGKRSGFLETTTDPARIFEDSEVDAVVIATRHDSHAPYVVQALKAGKHVFVEKPLCLTLAELEEIEAAYSDRLTNANPPLVMAGFNRRFAPQVQKVKALLNNVKVPKSFILTVNAGRVPTDHWSNDQDIGGGRLIGEACHFVDLLRHLAGCSITSAKRNELASQTQDTFTLELAFADGSIGSIHYFTNGSRSFPKERLEVFAAGGILQLDNFRYLRGFGWPGFRNVTMRRQDKGHQACASAFVQAIKSGGPVPIPFDEIREVSRVTIELSQRG